MRSRYLVILVWACLSGCGSGEQQAEIEKVDATAPPAEHSGPDPVLDVETNRPIPNNTDQPIYRILFMGNSHVTGLSQYLMTLFQLGLPEKNIEELVISTGGYLSERFDDGRSEQILKSTPWTHVVLQAQKYSQSGVVDYPTTAAQRWIALAKDQGATPILFPEHPQRGNLTEGRRLQTLHATIAKQQASCVAPVGLVWDRVIALRPTLSLHQVDGNHASSTGSFLTALVFYQVISQQPADLLPFIPNTTIDRTTQDLFGQIVSEIVAENPPCAY